MLVSHHSPLLEPELPHLFVLVACVGSTCILRSGQSFLLMPELCRVGIQQLLMSPGLACGRSHQPSSRPTLACFGVGISHL